MTKMLMLPASNLISLRKLHLRGHSVCGVNVKYFVAPAATVLTYLFIDFWSLATAYCTLNESQRAAYVLTVSTAIP